MSAAAWVAVSLIAVVLVGGPLLLAWLSHIGRWPSPDRDTRTDRWVRRHPRLTVAIPPALMGGLRVAQALVHFGRGEVGPGLGHLGLAAVMVLIYWALAREWRKAAFRKAGSEAQREGPGA